MNKHFTTALFLTLALAACGPQKTVQPPASTASTSAPQYAYVTVPPAPTQPAGPQILEVALLAREYHAPGPVAVRVRTSTDVVKVTARVMGREVAVPKTADGTFEAHQELPDLPFFLKNRDYAVEFVAAANDGRSAQTTVTIHLAR